MDAALRYKLRKFINQLKSIRGRHTELVTIYVPAGYELVKIIQHIQQEQSTAQNIKDKNTRKNVIDSLERIVRHLRLFKHTPPNGLAVFAGDQSDNPSKTDIQVWSIEPPIPVSIRLYRCDHDFKLDILEEMLDVANTYGLIVIDNRDASVGFLKGTRITKSREMHSAVPGKMKAGGQCLSKDTMVFMADGQFIRLEEVLEGDEVMSFDFENKKLITSKVVKKWITRVDEVYKIFTEKDTLECSQDHLIFLEDGSTLPAEKINPHLFLIDENGKPVKVKDVLSSAENIEMIDIEVENKNFIANGLIVHNSQQRFARLREIAAHEFYVRVAEVANKEFLETKDLKGILIGGPGITKEKFLNGDYINNQLKPKVIAVKDLSYTGDFGLEELVQKSQDELAKEDIIKEKKILDEFFTMLAKDSRKAIYGREKIEKAMDMGAIDRLIIHEDFADEYEELQLTAVTYGTEVIIISKETTEGDQLKNLKGIGAILRFQVD